MRTDHRAGELSARNDGESRGLESGFQRRQCRPSFFCYTTWPGAGYAYARRRFPAHECAAQDVPGAPIRRAFRRAQEGG